MPYDSFAFLDPWAAVSEYAHNLEQELSREVTAGHPLFMCKPRAIAQRIDNDDVLFQVDSTEHPYVVVHLSWTGEPENDPKWPDAQLFSTWHEWVEKRMKLDNAEFSK